MPQGMIKLSGFPMKTPIGATWRLDPALGSPEGLRGSRRQRTCRCYSATASCVCSLLVGALVVLSTRPAGVHQPQLVTASNSLLIEPSAGREVPAACGPAIRVLTGQPSHHNADDSSHEVPLRCAGHHPVDRDSPQWDPAHVNITSCMAEDDDQMPFTVEHFEAARPGSLRAGAAFYSALRRAPPVTVTVTATAGKLSALEGLCNSWPGPLSVAFYLAVVEDGSPPDAKVAAAVAAVNTTFEQLERQGRCQADIVVYSERVADERAATLFPINILRNNAILMARTPLVPLADADLLIGADLAEAMADPSEHQQALDLCRRKHFLVVPALETYREGHAYKCAKGGKKTVTEYMQEKKAWGFKMQRTKFLHSSTDYARWAKAKAPFQIQKPHERYEPWGLMYRPALGFFDVRYRGYGRNKIQHLHMHMRQMGWRYSVHPRGYMMHRPHPITAAKQQFMAGNAIAAQASAAVAAGADPKEALAAAAKGGAPGTLLVFASNNGFFEEQETAGDRYRPLLTPGLQRCRAQLPWWQIYGLGGEPMQAVTAPEPEARLFGLP